MIAQVALTVICIPPAIGVSEESLRDRVIRDRFPAEQYLAASLELDRDPAAVRDGEGRRLGLRGPDRALYRELERRVGQEPGVVAVTFGDRLPGMVAVRAKRGGRDAGGRRSDPDAKSLDG